MDGGWISGYLWAVSMEVDVGLFDWLLGRPAAASPPDDAAAESGAGQAVGDQVTADDHSQAKDRLLFPRPKFQGEFTPENLAFDSNLQEFAQRVAYICSLENSGKISPDDAHQQIRGLYRQLSRSHKGLKIADP